MKSKRILHLISSSGLYGAEKVVLNLCIGLRMRGFNPLVAIITDPAEGYKELLTAADKAGVDSIVIECKKKFGFGALGKLRKIIKNRKIEIIHSHGYKSNIYGLIASLNIKIERISTCHLWFADSFKMKLYEYLDKLILNLFDKIVAVSAPIKAEVIKAGINSDKVIRIDNGIDLPIYGSAKQKAKGIIDINNKEKVIGVIGRLSEQKGHRYLIEATAEIVKVFPDIKVLIIGEGPLGPSLREQVANLHLHEKIEFTGVRDDIPELLNLMDIFVLPSLNEGMPMALLEAMAAKVPIIASAVGDIPAIIDDGKSGMLCKPGDKEDLIRALLFLLKNSDRGRDLAAEAFITVTDRYSLVNMTNQYIKLYLSQG